MHQFKEGERKSRVSKYNTTYGGITRIRLQGLISARNVKAPLVIFYKVKIYIRYDDDFRWIFIRRICHPGDIGAKPDIPRIRYFRIRGFFPILRANS